MKRAFRAFPAGYVGITAIVLLAGCADPQVKPSDQHLKPVEKPAGTPPPLAIVPTVEPPKPAPRQETYSVVVNNVQARDVLFCPYSLNCAGSERLSLQIMAERKCLRSVRSMVIKA